MAPLGSSDSPKSRFSNEFCSTSGAIKPSSGFGLDVLPHTQRLVLNTASSSEDAAFRSTEQHARHYYLQRRQQASQNGGSLPAPSNSNHVGDSADDMVTELPKQDAQLGQALQSFMQESMSGSTAVSSLMRYNSAPGSMLASLTGMGNAILGRDTDLGQFLSNADMHLEMKKPMDPSHEPPHPIKSRGATGAAVGAQAENLSNHMMGLLPVYGPYHRSFDANNKEVLSQMAMDVDGAPVLIRPHDGLQDAGRSALDLPSSYHFKGAYPTESAHLENGNGAAHGIDSSKNGLMRHSSLPTSFLSQLNEEHEGQMLGSSSGNSSEEGSFERQSGQGYLGSFPWDDAGIGSPNASCAAKKRIRDLEEKGYCQKGDSLEQSVFGNYFGMPSATSPENAHFMDKLSPDAVLCRTRAKRGCATHPRSIAERVRRTKISERMKKLQELVPNMDKQTNTAEMLDEAVEYVKYLQRQVQELREGRSKCECSCGKQEDTSST